VLLHPTSLPGPHGIGTLGAGARTFLDWLSEAGIGLWQVLPLVPPGAGSSPYSTQAAFAGNPWILDLESLVQDGLLSRTELDSPGFDPDRVDYGRVCDFKGPRLDRAADRLMSGARPDLSEELERFRADNPWVEDAALFMALHDVEQGRPWWLWPAPLRDRTPQALGDAREELRETLNRVVALQYLFFRQWRQVREHAHLRGVHIIGDMPIYVDRDSADVWAHRDLFQLEADGRPRAQSGVPPDYFSPSGQLWGNPVYDWEALSNDGYGWWIDRLRRALSQVDLIRLDHFRGFASYWAVPMDAPDARTGRWVPGPGKVLFDRLREALGPLPLVAEDLGIIDGAVHALRRSIGLPGMRVLQFAFGEGSDHPFLPHNHEPHTVVYTGTHDNDTTLGWYRRAPEPVRDHVRRYLGCDGHDVVWDLIRVALASVADTAIVPMQDILVLDERSRMNQPGVAEGNWTWRVRVEAFHADLAGRLRSLCELYSRGPTMALQAPVARPGPDAQSQGKASRH